MVDQVTATLLRAAELTAAGQPGQAVALLRPVLLSHPEHADAWCHLAAAHLDAGEPDPALTAAKRAIVLGGDPAWAQRLAALALAELDRPAEAVVAARESVRCKPLDWRCHVVLAEALASHPTLAGDALGAARRAVELAGDQARPYQVLGDAAMRARDWATAQWAYRAALDIDPHDPEVRANLDAVHRNRARAAGAGGLTGADLPQALAGAERALRALVRRLVGLVAVGTLLLLLAGLPAPSTALTAPALLLVGLAGAAALLALAVLLTAGWALALASGTRGLSTLAVAFGCALAAGVLCRPGARPRHPR